MRSRGWTPNQHGAWAMLISPLLVGGLSAGFDWTLIPLTTTWLLGYAAFFAASLWLKSRRPRDLRPAMTYITAACASGLITLGLHVDLIRWAPMFVLPLGFGLWAASARRDRSLLSGILTVLGSTLMTIVAHDAGGGHNWTMAWQLTLVQFCYFGGTIFYVKSAIRERNNRRFWWLSLTAHSLATVVAATISLWLVPVFALLTLRAGVVPRLGWKPKTLGIAEIAPVVMVALSSLLVV